MIPVLDLKAGRAVLASRGMREAYGPVRSVLVPQDPPGDPLALARAYRDRLGCDEWYVADLDAIIGGAPQRAALRGLAGLGGRLLVDAGVSTAVRARETLADGGRTARVVAGLETLPSFAALADVAHAVGGERLVFSLDLREGRPVAPAVGGERLVFSLDLREGRPVAPAGAAHHGALPPLELVGSAVEAGAAAILVLDLARIGSGRGVDLDLVAAIRRAHSRIELLAGGGIASRGDVERLADAGCDAVLVATALHDGRLGREDIEAVRGGRC